MLRALVLMASSIITCYCFNPEQSGSSAGLLALTAPAASTSTTGWTVANTVTNRHSRMTFRTEKASATFSATTQPNGPPLGKAMDSWRLSVATTGSFSTGTWYSQLSVIAVTGGGAADGRAYFRIWASPNADGSSSFSELATDQFTGSDENPVTTNWTSSPGATGEIQRLSNTLRAAALGTDSYAYNDTITWPANQISECKINLTGATGNAGPAVRMATGAETCYFIEVDETRTTMDLTLVNAGAFTNLLSVTTTTVSGDSIALECIGSTLRMYRNRIQAGGDVVNTVLTSGNAGVHIADNSGAITIQVDDWAGGAPTLRELSNGQMVGTTVTNVSTTVAQTSSASTQISATSMKNDFLFLQVAWERTGAGSATNHDILARLGPLSIGNGSGLITTTFDVVEAGGAAPGGGGYYLARRRDPMTGAS